MTAKTVKYSTIPVEKYSLTWRIANFRDIICSKTLLEAQRCRFEMGDEIGLPTKWICNFQVNKPKSDNRDWIGIYLSVDKTSVPESCKNLLVRATIKVSHGWYFNATFGEPKDMTSNNYAGWGFRQFIPLNEKIHNLPLKSDGSLSVQLKVTLFNANVVELTTVQYPLSYLMAVYQKKFFGKLQKDTEAINTGASNTLLEMYSRDGQTILVDSKLMCARSPVLKRMASVSKSGTVRWVGDCTLMSLQAVIHFMETGKLNGNWKKEEVLGEFVRAAYELELNDLLKFLDETMGLVCTKENAVKLLLLARELGMEKANELLFEFIREHLNEDMLYQLLESKQDPIPMAFPKKKKQRGMMAKLISVFF